jgi:hypothetical protein
VLSDRVAQLTVGAVAAVGGQVLPENRVQYVSGQVERAVVRLRMSTSSRSRRFSRRSAASSSRSLLVSLSRSPANP